MSKNVQQKYRHPFQLFHFNAFLKFYPKKNLRKFFDFLPKFK